MTSEFLETTSSLTLPSRELLIVYMKGVEAEANYKGTYQTLGPIYNALGTCETCNTPTRNLSDAQTKSFRAKLVNQIWESDLRSDLVDRIVDAYAVGYFDVPTLRSAIRRAKSRKLDYESSNGAKGKDAIWKTLASWLKGVYESHGRQWSPTSSALEPRPQQPPRPKIVGVDPDDPVIKEMGW